MVSIYLSIKEGNNQTITNVVQYTRAIRLFYASGVSSKRHWFSGKIQRCHRWAPGSIPGWRTTGKFLLATDSYKQG
jgi:hypothetical protein